MNITPKPTPQAHQEIDPIKSQNNVNEDHQKTADYAYHRTVPTYSNNLRNDSNREYDQRKSYQLNKYNNIQ